jgi:hypothetical protein
VRALERFLESAAKQTTDGAAARITWDDVKQPPIPRMSPPSALPSGLAHIIARLEAAIGRHDGSDRRAAPSAGACYPYELLISAADRPVFGVVDLDRRRIVTRSSDSGAWDGAAFAYFLFGRPWLSVRKYGRRGYLYHLLDAGHAVLNLSLAAGHRRNGARLVDSRLIRQAGRQSIFRVGSLLAAGVLEADDGSAPLSTWVMQETASAIVHPPLDEIEEMLCPLLPPAPEPVQWQVAPEPDHVDLARGIADRHSAARLADAVSTDLIARTMKQCGEWFERLIPAFGMPTPRFRVFSRDPYVGEPLPDCDWIGRSLIGQTDLAGASTFIVMHSNVRDAAGDALTASTQRLIIASGIAGEIVYLVATRAGLGVTGIGGINPGLWAQLCGTPDDVLYLIAIGREMSGEKFDRTVADGSHA